GAAIDELDRLMVSWGFPVGPITLLDEVGLDVGEKASGVLPAAFGERLAAAPAFSKLVQDGRLGRKAGRGFYRYGGGRKRGVDPAVSELLGIHPNGGPHAAEIIQRLVLVMLNEAARAVGEGVVRAPRDGDIAAIFGFGFPPFRGGPVRHAAEARAARDLYLATLDLIERAHAQSHVSVKLTQMGLDIDEGACVEYVRAIAARARDGGSFMRIDMEGSAYTERTLRLFKQRLHPE